MLETLPKIDLPKVGGEIAGDTEVSFIGSIALASADSPFGVHEAVRPPHLTSPFVGLRCDANGGS